MLISVVIPTYNEEGNVARVHERLSAVFAALDVEWELIFSVDPVDRPHRGADPRAARARPAREDAALLAPLRPARGDARRDGGGRRATPWS